MVRGSADPVLTDVAEVVALLTTFGAVQVLRLVLALVLLVTKRFRHLAVALATFVVSDWLVLTFLDVQRPPGDVEPLIDATDFRFPSWPMTALAITLFAMPFVLAPAGRIRRRAMTAAWAVVVVVALSRLYLAADYPSNVAYAAVFGWVLTETLFRRVQPAIAVQVPCQVADLLAALCLLLVRGLGAGGRHGSGVGPDPELHECVAVGVVCFEGPREGQLLC